MDVKDEVGVCAGDIWKTLSMHKRGVMVQHLIRAVGKPTRTVVMALGWLLREDKIEMYTHGVRVYAKLKR